MRRILALAGLVFVVLMTGCMRSVHPIYTNEDLTFDAALLGTWLEKGDKDIWILEREGDKAYKLTCLEDGDQTKSSTFEAHLVRVGEEQFLDLFPEKPDFRGEFYKFHLLPVHSFVRLSIQRDSVRLTTLDYDWIRKKIAERELKLPHLVVDGDPILTGETKELRAFLIRIAKEKGAYGDPVEFQRRN